MSDKYFFGKCGGKDCRLREWTTNACAQSFRFCDNDHKACYKSRYEKCPYGKTIEEWAEMMAKQSVVNSPVSKCFEKQTILCRKKEYLDVLKALLSRGAK